MLQFGKFKEYLGPIKLIIDRKISHINKKIFGKNITTLKVDTNQGLFLVDPEDFGVSRKLIKYKSYGTNEISQLLELISKEDDVLFVGAHIGAIAIPIAKSVRSVTAIEANPKTFKLLKENISLNASHNIVPIQVAASDKKEEIKFVQNRTNSGGSKRMPLRKSWMYFYDKPEIIDVEAEKLDTILEGKRFNIIFMDIEGSEYFALCGMPNLLSTAKYLFVEYVAHHLKNVSGISPQEFLNVIEPYFSKLFIPSKKLLVEKVDFLSILQKMYDKDQSEDVIIFSK